MLKRFMTLFAGLNRAHGEYTVVPNPDEVKQTGPRKTVMENVTAEKWQRHLDGKKKGLGIVPIRDDSTCVWGAIDIDDYKSDIVDIEKRVKAAGLRLMCFRTKSGGVHLYQFCSEPVPAPVLRAKLKEFAISLGYIDVEIFPKQDRITEDDTGNWINMPYFDHANTKRYAIRNGEPLTAEQMLDYAEQLKVTLNELRVMKPKISAETGEDDFSDGPPCLETLLRQGIQQGTKNTCLFNMGVYARQKYPDGWEEKIFEYNRMWFSGTTRELTTMIKTIGRKDYKFQCGQSPMTHCCNKQECFQRKYGLKPDNMEVQNCILDEVDRPIICNIPQEGSSDEPSWDLKINGKEFHVTIDMFRDQQRFLREYFKKFHVMVLPVKDAKWRDAVNLLTQEATMVDAPEDSGPEGQLWLHIEGFCAGKVQAKTQSELLLSKPFTENGRTYFRSKDLMKYLDQQHFRAFKETEVWAILRRRGADHHKLKIKGQCVGCWSVTEFEKQTEDFEPVTEKF